MNRIFYTILLMLLCAQVYSQNLSIIDALHLNENPDYKTRRPLRIVEKTTSFNINDRKSSDKIIKTFDEAGMLLTFEFYGDNDSLFARITYVNDTLHRIKLSATREVWTRNGISKQTSLYAYDRNYFLTGTTDIDGQGKIIRKTSIRCNEKGHPVELSLFDGDGKFYSKEKATYNYTTNKLLRFAETKDGQIVTDEDSSKISLKEAGNFPEADEVYNSNGDIIRWKGKRVIDKGMIYEREYVYDESGNWTETKIMLLTTNEEGQPLRKVKQMVSKEYTYR
jgi:hypothetical protein